ncbi:MAG TPA: 16S rRNA methyltransferase [Planctomycetota bacterium]|nr:16S rRNA methyltransferase [Planctomycetota bacterium]HRR78887.1 16S rRNA methyltransferase [Planctomycetota bacterium]HRT93910.1 16S rRNA methyltransferase [Planctomycetota bacterium]
MSALDDLVAAVLATPKYRAVCPDTVRRLGAAELAKRSGPKAALKATKARLHQVFGAFERAPDYERLFGELAAARASGEAEAFRAACRAALNCHASTSERLPILGRFYAEVFALTGVPSRVLDLACGLHPLAIPWMGLPPEASYRACDLDGRAVGFLNRCGPLLGRGFEAFHADILCSPPAEEADVAFLLKAAASLERQERGGALRVLDALRARHTVVSFPVASLGGRAKGMRENYETGFRQMLRGRPWRAQRLPFPAELAFVVTK